MSFSMLYLPFLFLDDDEGVTVAVDSRSSCWSWDAGSMFLSADLVCIYPDLWMLLVSSQHLKYGQSQ